jgi:SAM-dependent methyltransferase
LTDSGSIDLRLQRAKNIRVDFELGTPFVPFAPSFEPLRINPRPEVDFRTESVPWHLRREVLSYFPRAHGPESLALDLGCGSGLHRSVCEAAGFQWVGLDYDGADAPILGDGHALPFKADAFEFVLSVATMEHLRYPLVVAKDVFRVLRPGGLFIGTVAFLEPFHGDSFYHHTHLGTYNTLQFAGFEIERVSPNPEWSSLRAQATMAGLFPKIPKPIGRAVVWPLEMMHKLWWRAGRFVNSKATDNVRLLTNTGAFEFVARKPVATVYCEHMRGLSHAQNRDV